MTDRSIETTPDPVDIAVGLNVRRLRKAKGFNQEQLGRALAITFQQIQKYERGTNRISASKTVAICRALDVSLAEIFAGVDVRKDAPAADPQGLRHALFSTTRKGSALFDLVAAMDDASLDAVIGYARGLDQLKATLYRVNDSTLALTARKVADQLGERGLVDLADDLRLAAGGRAQ